MTAKDYVYLGLIALAAATFYVHGFQAGAEEVRRSWRELLKRRQPTPLATPPLESARVRRAVALGAGSGPGRPRAVGGPSITGDFCNN